MSWWKQITASEHFSFQENLALQPNLESLVPKNALAAIQTGQRQPPLPGARTPMT
jgi:hypothetical protein